jgi:hypothetical protein
MPTQKRRRLDQQRTRTRQRLAERGEYDTVGGLQLRPGGLTPQHLQLVPQQKNLYLLSLLRASEQEHQLEESARQPVAEAKDLKQQRTSTHTRTLRADHPSACLVSSEAAPTADEFLGPTGCTIANPAADGLIRAGYRVSAPHAGFEWRQPPT